MIIFDSVFRKGKHYYLQAFLEEFKYIFKEKKISRYININLRVYFDNCDEETFGGEFNT